MYAIIDKRVSSEIKENLQKYVTDIFEFSTKNITYNAISCHPDIFMFQHENELIIAPNTPKNLIAFLHHKSIAYTFGEKPIQQNLDDSVLYNCVSTARYFFCKAGKPDVIIQQKCDAKKHIILPQSFTRCSMFTVEKAVVTSDKGIVKALEQNNIDYCYFSPDEITIKDYKNGFIGGTMGTTNNTVFFLGDIFKHKDGEKLNAFITKQNKKVVCLGSNFLYDGGGIFFVS